MIEEHVNFIVIGTFENSDYYQSKRNGIPPMTYEEAMQVKPGDSVLAAVSDELLHIEHGCEYTVLSLSKDTMQRVVTFKITNKNTKLANGRVIEVGKYYSYTLHHNLARLLHGEVHSHQ